MLPIQSIITRGSGGLVVDIECHISNGLPSMVVVGLGSKAVSEAKERIRSALASSQIALPRKRITINLAPADIPKESTSLDLPIALAIMQASGQFKQPITKQHAAIGELGLDGSIRSVRGVISKLIVGREQGIKTFFVPQGNMAQALLVPRVGVVAVERIKDLYLALNNERQLPTQDTGPGTLPAGNQTHPTSYLSEVAGQLQAKRALVISASGGHSVLLNGPPGTGKSMLAKTLPSLLPKLSPEEMLETTQLHSLASLDYEQLVLSRPFRAPHHTTTKMAIVGGGTSLKPGEISLAHRGVLFLDELPEFDRSTIEALRQPLEDRSVVVARAKETARYPANFILIATANPCPCGYYGESGRCDCSPHRITQYRQKLSGPILDRFDLQVTVERVDHGQLWQATTDPSAEKATRKIVEHARAMQAARFGNTTKLNSDLSNSDIRLKAVLSAEALNTLVLAATRLNLSARSYMRVVKIGRTIADMAGSEELGVEHIAEALQYRPRAPRE